MNKCFFQKWEESERGWGVRPDGCSIHLDTDSYKKYLNGIYVVRQNESIIPNEYDRIVGDLIDCFISDDLFSNLIQNKSIRLMEYEMNNLISLEEIIFKS